MFRRIQYSRIKPGPPKFRYAVSARANFLSLAFMLGQSLGRKRRGRPTSRLVCEKRGQSGRRFFFQLIVELPWFARVVLRDIFTNQRRPREARFPPPALGLR